MPSAVYVPSRVGEGYFTDWQAPVAGDNGKVWAYNHSTGKFEPYTIPTIAPGGSSGYIQYNNAGSFGASGVYWDSANSRVGIGTTAPVYSLTIKRGAVGNFFEMNDTTESWRLGTIAGSDFSTFRLGSGTTQNSFAITRSGNVGIGTTSPSRTLDVNGSVNVATALIVPIVRPASDSTTALKVTKADGTTAVVTVDTTNNRVSVNSSGGLGRLNIDTVSTDNIIYANLYSATSEHSNYWFSRRSQSGTQGTLATTLDGSYIGVHYFQGVNSSNSFAYGAEIQVKQRGSAGASFVPCDIVFNTYSSVTKNADVLVLSNAGTVGVSTASPTAWLHLPASTTSYASLRIPSGTAPTTPNDGDIWYPSSGRLAFRRSTTSEIFATGVQATGGAATAGASYTSTEQTMLQRAYDACRAFGLLS